MSIDLNDRMISNKSLGNIMIQSDFNTFKEMLLYQNSDESFGNGIIKPNIAISSLLEEKSDDESENALTKKLSRKKNRDTSFGGNDAVNCDWQFCENDDIMHDMHKIGNTDSSLDIGMSRVYSETFDDKQQIMYLSFGVPDFRSLTGFFNGVIDPKTASLMNGGEFGIFDSIFRFVGKASMFILELPFLPLIYLNKMFGGAFSHQASKFFDFKATMPLYWKAVNTMMAHIGVNLGLLGILTKGDDDTAAANSNISEGMLELVSRYKSDVFSMMCKKDVYDDISSHNDILDLDSQIDLLLSKTLPEGATDTEKEAWYMPRFLSGFLLGARTALHESANYVGFKIGKSVDSSESASNNTGELALLGMINQKSRTARDWIRQVNGGDIGDGMLLNAMEGAISAGNSVLSGAMSMAGLGSVGEILKGSGYVDIPEMWTDSNFSKSYNFTIQLRAPAADIVSQFYYIYGPLCMLLAGAFPRAIGRASYTSPFLVKAFCKGMFHIPMGIIDNITIKRGDSEFGWTMNNLPTCVDVSFTIKDLSPIMYIAIATGSTKEIAEGILGQNSSYQEYLLTLSGASIKFRTLYANKLKRSISTIAQVSKDSRFNPALWGFSFGNNTTLGRMLYLASPSRLPRN